MPLAKPSINLDFINSRQLDPRITFSRPSSATRTNKDGLIELVPFNKPRFDYGYDQVQVGPINLFSKSQDLSSASWVKSSTTAQKSGLYIDGDYAYKVFEDSSVNYHYVSNYITPVAGELYTASAVIKKAGRNFAFVGMAGGGNPGSIISINLTTGALAVVLGTVVAYDAVSLGDDWWLVSVTAATTTTAVLSIQIRISVDGIWNNRSYLGDVLQGMYVYRGGMFKGQYSSADLMKTGGIPKTEAFGVPNVVNGDFMCRGLLIEEQRTNLLPYSADIGNASYSKGTSGAATITITPNYALAPDGTMTACRVQAKLNGGVNAADWAQIYRTVTPAVQTTSIYARSLGGQVRTYLSGFNNFASEALIGQEWKRFSSVDTAGTSTQARILLLRGGQVPAHSDEIDILLWGAQVEVGSFPTSYIPTSGAASTRASELTAVINDLGKYSDQPEATLYAENTLTITPVSSYARVAAVYAAASSNWRAQLLINNSAKPYSETLINSSNEAGMYLSTPLPANGAVFKSAVSFKLNDAAFSASGEAAQTDNLVGPMLSGRMYIGSNNFNGHIRSVRYFPSRLSNTELQSLTA